MADLISSNRKLFEKADLISVYTTLISASEKAPYTEDCFAMEKLAEASIKIAKILSYDHKQWHEMKGASYEKEMLKCSGGEMIQMHWCEKAIAEFQLANNDTKVTELHLAYAEYRKSFKLDSVPVELEREKMQEWYDYLDANAKQLVFRNEPEVILNYLSNSNDTFPDITWLKEHANKESDSFLDTVALSKIDINKNSSKKVITEQDQEWHKIFEQYNYYIELAVLPRIRRIFYYGFLRQKICYSTVINYLAKRTWIGSTLVSKDSGGEEVKYNWLSLIAPALHNFHLGLEALFFSKSNHISLILCTDSLVMKFEGLIRDFARLSGAPTTVLAKGLMREMYIEELLELQQMKNYFDENDMLLFRYLFVSKNGLNLRNNIAHSFFHFNDYRVEQMALMIMALLRLGKYEISTDKQTL